MKIFTKTTLLIVGLSLAPSQLVRGDTSEHPKGEVNHRLHHQHHRIHQGVKNGSLTKAEAKNLHSQDRAIHHEEHAMRKANGGNLTNNEKRELNHQENQVSKEIYKEKHD